MPTLERKIDDFLAQKRIAVAGVSRKDRSGPANLIYRKLKSAGYEVFPVNPATTSVEDDPCYPSVEAIPGEPVDGVVIGTTPAAAETIVRGCAEAGVRRVWMHRSFGEGSVSGPATRFCEEHDISVIAGACPMMYCRPVDFGHRCMKWCLKVTGNLPH